MFVIYLSPCVLTKSGSFPVLAFKSPHIKTFRFVWKWQISSCRIEKVSSL